MAPRMSPSSSLDAALLAIALSKSVGFAFPLLMARLTVALRAEAGLASAKQSLTDRIWLMTAAVRVPALPPAVGRLLFTWPCDVVKRSPAGPFLCWLQYCVNWALKFDGRSVPGPPCNHFHDLAMSWYNSGRRRRSPKGGVKRSMDWSGSTELCWLWGWGAG